MLSTPTNVIRDAADRLICWQWAARDASPTMYSLVDAEYDLLL
jgi:hypothetical protein